MTWPCFKCGFECDTREDCPRCVTIKLKYPELFEYVEACIAKAKQEADNAEWERAMGDDL